MNRVATARKVARAHVQGIRQETQYTCMAASLAACLKALGKDVTERDVNKVMGAGPMKGARWEEALAASQYFGLRGTLVVPATIEMLRDWTDRGVPVMIAWNPEGRPWSHASVVVEVDDNDVVHVMDPNCPDPKEFFREVPLRDFYKKWMEPVGSSMIVRRPALAIELEVTQDGMPTEPQIRLAGKKERQQQKDRARARRLQQQGNPGKSEKSDAQKLKEKVRRQQMIEDGTYFQSGGGYHEPAKYQRREKHKKDWSREASTRTAGRRLEKDYYKQLEKHPELEIELSNLIDQARYSGASDAGDVITAIETLIYDAGWEGSRIDGWLKKLAQVYRVDLKGLYAGGVEDGEKYR